VITRLRLKGFRRYVDETFELGPGVTFINGRNNAGKTTLFLAIEYALTGTVSGARSQAVLLNPAAKGPRRRARVHRQPRWQDVQAAAPPPAAAAREVEARRSLHAQGDRRRG